MRKDLLAAGLAFFILSAVPVWALEAEPIRVLEVSGKTEVLNPASPRWRPLNKLSILKKGYKVRTGPNGLIELAFNRQLSHVAKIKPNSQIGILDAAHSRFSLDRGKILFLFEDEAPLQEEKRTPTVILTKDTRVEFLEGGFSAESTPNTVVRAYSRSAEVAGLSRGKRTWPPQTIEEGFKFSTGPQGTKSRMAYADYSDWQVWLRKSYQRKDDLAADRFEKETVIEY